MLTDYAIELIRKHERNKLKMKNKQKGTSHMNIAELNSQIDEASKMADDTDRRVTEILNRFHERKVSENSGSSVSKKAEIQELPLKLSSDGVNPSEVEVLPLQEWSPGDVEDCHEDNAAASSAVDSNPDSDEDDAETLEEFVEFSQSTLKL